MGLVSYTHPDFWTFYNKLPKKVQNLANEKFELFKQNPNHPSLEFAKKGNVWTVNIGIHYRAIGYKEYNNIIWFWIGSHEDYNKLMKRL